MAPTIPEGSRVWVVPLERAPASGEICLFRTASGWLVHRVIHVARLADDRWVFHRGDGAGRLGIASLSAVAGRVEAVLGAAGVSRPGPVPAAALYRGRLRCRFYAASRRAAERLGLAKCPGVRAFGAALLRRFL
jgi:hypothetical protein